MARVGLVWVAVALMTRAQAMRLDELDLEVAMLDVAIRQALVVPLLNCTGSKVIYEDKCVHRCPANSTLTRERNQTAHCIPCPDGQVPLGNTSCAACNASLPYADAARGKCVLACPPGTAPAGDEHAAPNLCQACAPGLFSDPSSHACVRQCPRGAVPRDQECLLCAGNQSFADTRSNQCVQRCPSGFAPDAHKDNCEPCVPPSPFSQDGVCLPECPAGSAPDLSYGCQPCPGGQYSNPSTRQCVSACPAGHHADNATRSCVHTCSEFRFRDEGVCVPVCPASTSPVRIEECLHCEPLSECSACDCTLCAGETPYADHKAHKCVQACPGGAPANAQQDCP